MIHFSQLFNDLDGAASIGLKVKALAFYFEEASDRDKVWTISLLKGQRPKRIVTSAILRNWAMTFSSVRPWLFEESHQFVGDLTETISLVVGGSENVSERSLNDWLTDIIELQGSEKEEIREFVEEAWSTLDFPGRYVFNKLVTGGFRMVVSQRVLLKALSVTTGVDAKALAHRITGSWDPSSVTFEELVLSDSILDEESSPYSFSRAKEFTGALEDLGHVDDWIIEKKWDGLRGQLIIRNSRMFLWSKNGDLITSQFPEFEPLKALIEDGSVIDGEILVWTHSENSPARLSDLERRLKRKKPGKKFIEENPAIFMAYDLLEFEGEDISHLTLLKRREKLRELINGLKNGNHLLRLSESIAADQWNQVTEARETMRERGCAGLMLKHKESRYEDMNTENQWLKWKTEPITIHAVLLYAEGTSGRHMGTPRFFTMAVWDGDLLVPITKVEATLSEEELDEVSLWIKENTKERFGPVRSVNPELVFELTFDDISPSTRHKSGLTLRSPRLKSWKRGFEVLEAITLQEMMAFF